MQFHSTRNLSHKVSFTSAILNCTPEDGGMYAPATEDNLLPWLYYMDERTSFSSIAGSLTSALLKEEFSPLISEAIATKAFNFSPKLKQLDNNLYTLELFHGPTGSHKDFGISFLASCLEHILLMEDKNAVILTPTNGETGSGIIQALKNKKHVKAILLYAKGTLRGISESDYIWNGGNILPIEIQGNEKTCFDIAREIFKNKNIVEKYSLTLANTSNIGRLLPQTFFYTYAFTRLKNKTHGDIYYALDAGNYGNLTAGLYSWKFSLPINGFITNNTTSLHLDVEGNCQVQDSIIPLQERSAADHIKPSNIERLEEVFFTNPAVIKGFVFPADVSSQDCTDATKEAFVKYGVLLDEQTSIAYAAAKKRQDITADEDTTTVILAKDHPFYDNKRIKHCCGETIKKPDYLEAILTKNTPNISVEANTDKIIEIIKKYL